MIIKKENELALGRVVLSEMTNWYIVNGVFLKNNNKIAYSNDCLYVLYAKSLLDIINKNFNFCPICDDCGITIMDIKKLKNKYKDSSFILNVGEMLKESEGIASFYDSPNTYLSIINGFNTLCRTNGKHWSIKNEESEESLSDIAVDALAD